MKEELKRYQKVEQAACRHANVEAEIICQYGGMISNDIHDPSRAHTNVPMFCIISLGPNKPENQ